MLKETVRPTDRVYRMGGEEFAVLLSPCTPEAVQQVAERVCTAVAREVGHRAGLPGERITVSGGLVRVQGSKREMLGTADERLYATKDAGRNHIVATLVWAGPQAHAS